MSNSQESMQRLKTTSREFIAALRALIKSNGRESLAVADAGAAEFLAWAETLEADSCAAIIDCLQELFKRHADADEPCGPLELETLELAADWLEQLTVLHIENLPAPQALIKELLYTFDLVKRSQGATSLHELLANDPFADDPGLATDTYVRPEKPDPFAEDPGFGMEFDLLQRALNRDPRPSAQPDDPFTGDDEIRKPGEGEASPAGAYGERLPYDVFAGDPPVGED